MRCALLIAAAALLLPSVAVAGSIEFEVVPKVLAGSKDRPTLTLHLVEDCSDVLVKLTRDDGKTISTRTGPMAAGTSRKIPVDVPQGREYRFTGTLEVKGGKSEETIDVSFAAEVVVPARLSLDKSKVDLEKHVLEVSSTRRTGKVEVVVVSDKGEEIGTTSVPFDGAAPGTALKVEPKEEPKLTGSITLIQEAVQKYGQFAEIKLYVAGHTDTVGPSDANRTLSLNRARAISEFFRRHGIKAPIFYDGFGEDALKVPTPDETDEVKNRRAEYIVAIEPPPVSSGRPASWKPLR